MHKDKEPLYSPVLISFPQRTSTGWWQKKTVKCLSGLVTSSWLESHLGWDGLGTCLLFQSLRLPIPGTEDTLESERNSVAFWPHGREGRWPACPEEGTGWVDPLPGAHGGVNRCPGLSAGAAESLANITRGLLDSVHPSSCWHSGHTPKPCRGHCPAVLSNTDSFAPWKWKWWSLSRVRLFATPWTVARQAPLSRGFSRQECWSGLPCPLPGDLPVPGIKPGCLPLQADSLPPEPPGKPNLPLK